MNKKAIYPGSFDPFTNGGYATDIIKLAPVATSVWWVFFCSC